MTAQLYERTCLTCGGTQFFIIGYEPRDWEVGLQGGYTADLLQPADSTISWLDVDPCTCTLTDAEREKLELEVAKDYGIGWEPAGLP